MKKKSFYKNITLIFLLLPGMTNFVKGEEGCILSIGFDEGKGKIAYDSSGNNHHATLHNCSWVEGKSGKGIRFKDIDSYISINSPFSCNSHSELTIDLWVKWRGKSLDIWGLVLDSRTWKQHNSGYFLAITDDRKVIFGINGQGLGADYLESTKKVKEKEWSHIVAIFKPNVLVLYIDGNRNEKETKFTSIRETKTPIILGKEVPRGPLHHFNGDIDNLKIYNRALIVKKEK